jgi:hypothetical protein
MSLDSNITYIERSADIPVELTKDLHRSFFKNQDNNNAKQRIENIYLTVIINPTPMNSNTEVLKTNTPPVWGATYLINFRVDSFSNLVMESPHSDKRYLSNALSAMQKANEVHVEVSMCNHAGLNGGTLYQTTWRYQVKKNA